MTRTVLYNLGFIASDLDPRPSILSAIIDGDRIHFPFLSVLPSLFPWRFHRDHFFSTVPLRGDREIVL